MVCRFVCRYDKTWSAVVEVFAENGLPIATIEKDSGIIATDWLNMAADPATADCGDRGLWLIQGRDVRFNVFLKDASPLPKMTVNANFGRHGALIGLFGTFSCARDTARPAR